MSTVRCGLFSALVFGLLAVQASASVFTMDQYNALLLRQVSVSDAGKLILVADSTGVVHWTDGTFPVYGAPMQGTAGYLGWLSDTDGDSFASIMIGAAGTAALNNIKVAGSYTAFELFLANDDDDPWDVQLYLEAGGTSYAGGFTTLPAGVSSTLTLNFGTTLDFTQLTDIGFEIRGDFSGVKPSNPDFFHISAVPVPGALALVLVGLGGVVRLRRKIA